MKSKLLEFVPQVLNQNHTHTRLRMPVILIRQVKIIQVHDIIINPIPTQESSLIDSPITINKAILVTNLLVISGVIGKRSVFASRVDGQYLFGSVINIELFG